MLLMMNQLKCRTNEIRKNKRIAGGEKQSHIIMDADKKSRFTYVTVTVEACVLPEANATPEFDIYKEN